MEIMLAIVTENQIAVGALMYKKFTISQWVVEKL
jgi:hypothetical protein